MKKFFEEFRKFIMRGNIIDMSVGVIVGGAFTSIVNGLTDNILEQIDTQLFAHEMVKISVLDGADKPAKEYLHEVAAALNAEEVCSIGRKFVVYKMSNKKGLKHIEY